MSQTKENSEDRAYRLIAESLIKSHSPGDFLFESALTHELGMSRTPVAIALNRLVSEGLIKKQPKKGCYIPKISLKDAHDVFRVRRILELEAIALVIAQKDEGVLTMLHANLDKATLAIRCDNFDNFHSVDLEFHSDLVASSKNEYLYEAWKRVSIRCTMYSVYFSSSLRQNQYLKETLHQDHLEILMAMRNNDVDTAIICINNHFDNIVSYAVDNTLVYDNV